MADNPIALDPNRLKEERKSVDFGTDEETEHNLVARDAEKAPADGDDPVAHPTAGVTPPAR